MLYSGLIVLPRSVFWSADFNGRSDNTDVITLPTPMSSIEFTSLERDIIDWLQLHCDDHQVQRQLPHLILRKRDYTGVGFFVHFSIPPNVAPPPDSVGDSTPLPGPDIASPELDAGAGTAIFLTEGKLDCLEIFAYGDSFPETIENYTLS